MDLISIIVPIYNVEVYLDECINSLLQQTYKNIEIILINDGSTDRSLEICYKYKALDNRIRVINKSNEGLGLTRNRGLDNITGKYVTFIDSDDYADNDLIKNLYKGIIENNADTCIAGFKRVNDAGEVLYLEAYENMVYTNEECINDLLVRMLGSSPEKSDSIRMSVWNVLFSVDIIKKNGLKFVSEREIISEDIIFDIDYYQHVKKVALIDTAAYNYRVNESSLTNKYREDRFYKSKILYNELYKRVNKIYRDLESTYRIQRLYFVYIKTCIHQENIKISGLSYKQAISNIKKICYDNQIQEIIKTYPINKLKLKQKIFLLFIRYKFSVLLYLFGTLS